MKKFQLKKLAMALVVILIGSQAFAQGRIDLNGAKSAQTCLNVDKAGFSATFSFSAIDAEEMSTEKGMFSNITMDGTFPSGEVGEPTIPVANKLIAIPFGADDVTVNVKSYTTEEYKLADYGIHQLYPQQPLLFKNQNPEDVPFEYKAEAYAHRGFVESPIAEVAIIGQIRGMQVASLAIRPVQYDAASNTIRVYNNIEVEVNYGKYDETAAYNEFARTFSPYFAGVYSKMFNNRALRDIYDEHPDLWQNPVKMLVIANRMFEFTLEPWIAWKTEKGFYVDVHYTDEIGSTATAIKSFIQQKYAEDAPTFLMIVGDKEQVSQSATGSLTSCVTDLDYSSVDGDEFPDMFHSRLSATTTSELQAMLDKSIEYEQFTMPDPSYLNKVLLIAGDDSSGYGVEVGRPTIWYASNYYYNAEHGYTNVYEYSHGTYTGCYNNLSTGVGFANYTAHGSQTSWADPSFSVSDVSSLTNEHKYFMAIGNCCQSGDWGYGTCFGEALTRAANKGAYAYIGSCPNTVWYNDYYFGVGATNRHDGTMPSYDETTMGIYDAIWTDDAWNTVCAVLYVGNLAGNEAQSLGYTMHKATLYYWQAYHVLGDGSVLPYRVAPGQNTVSHMPTLPIGMDFYTVTAEPGSYVGISKDGVLYGAGMIDETGTTDIAITPVTSGGNVKIVVTHPRYAPYITEVPAAAMTGAYVAVDSYVLNAPQANYGETLDMDITLKNVGAQTANNLTATLTTECEYVAINAGTGSVASLDPDATATMEGFQFTVAENVPDNTKAKFVLSVTDGTEVWDANVNITLHAPALEVESVAVSEMDVTFTFMNAGSAPFYGGTLSLTSCSPDLVFTDETIVVDDVVDSGETLAISVNYVIDAGVESGSTFEAEYDFVTGMFEVGDIFVVTYGSIQESFESGEFGPGWTFTPVNTAWTIVDGGTKGAKCMKSANAGVHNSDYTAILTTDVIAAGDFSFMFKVSCETGSSTMWDHLKFELDGVEKGKWAGTTMTGFEQFSVPVTTGTHEFKWTYHKDGSVNSGEDCAWVDDITFPPTNVYTFLAPATNLEAVVDGHDVALTWTASPEADHYVIKRDGVTIGTANETSYNDYVETAGTYRYQVYAVNASGSMSTPISTIVKVAFAGVDENLVTNLSVYPNPTSGVLNIVTNADNYEYQVINCVGQVVMSGNANGKTTINVSGLSGVYFLRVATDKDSFVRKITVK